MHWQAMAELGLGVLLSIVIGVEREFNSKSAGIRTCALVGLGSALFTTVSRNGAWILPGLTVTNVDGSRVAAQIVSGIGFLGAGLIFVRRDAVRGLTTAASVWMVAAVGMAAGAGVVDLAVSATLLYLLVVIGITPLRRRLPHARHTFDVLSVTYDDGKGALRDVMGIIGDNGVSVDRLNVLAPGDGQPGRQQTVRLDVRTRGARLDDLIRQLAELPHVRRVSSERGSASGED